MMSVRSALTRLGLPRNARLASNEHIATANSYLSAIDEIEAAFRRSFL